MDVPWCFRHGVLIQQRFAQSLVLQYTGPPLEYSACAINIQEARVHNYLGLRVVNVVFESESSALDQPRGLIARLTSQQLTGDLDGSVEATPSSLHAE